MGIFNGKLNRLIGNKKQKKVAEMLAEMLLEWEDGKDGKDGQDGDSDDESSESLPGIYKIYFESTVQDESGNFSAIAYFANAGLHEGISKSYDGIYIVPMYGTGTNRNPYNLLPTQILPLKELLEMGEYMYTFIDPHSQGDSNFRYKKVVITALTKFNPDDEQDEFLYAGLTLDIYDVLT